MGGSDWSNFTSRHDPEQVGGAHPRGYSTFINRLALIRDHRLMTLEESIHRITGLPAEMSGIQGIGVLREGARGDVCIFDYDELRAQSDYVHPFRPNLGLDYVLVGGKPRWSRAVHWSEKRPGAAPRPLMGRPIYVPSALPPCVEARPCDLLLCGTRVLHHLWGTV